MVSSSFKKEPKEVEKDLKAVHFTGRIPDIRSRGPEGSEAVGMQRAPGQCAGLPEW